MAHFAEIDDKGIVLRVVVIANNETINQDGTESEEKGIEICNRLFGGNWVQTSYNGNFRGRFASIGGTYDSVNNVFIDASPYPSWKLNTETHYWEAPIAKPNDGRKYMWDESLISWRDITDKLIALEIS
jgi:hypothetical protein